MPGGTPIGWRRFAGRAWTIRPPWTPSRTSARCATWAWPGPPLWRKGARVGHSRTSRFWGRAGPTTDLAIDGVSCTVCHQIQNINLGVKEGFTGGYSIDLTTRHGPPDGCMAPSRLMPGRTRIMESASEFRPVEAAHIQSAEFCANCHTLFTHALDADGNEAGELAEQAPYLEWLHSDYPGQATCQDCHMPVVEGEVSVTGSSPTPGRM